MWPWRTICFFLLIVCSYAQAAPDLTAGAAASSSSIRVDELRHGSLDRVVVWHALTAGLAVHQEGGDLLIGLPQGAYLVAPAGPGRDATSYGVFGQWVRGLKSGPGWARLLLSPGAHPRVRPLSGKIWIDVDGATARLLPGQFVPQVIEPVNAAPPPAAVARGTGPAASPPPPPAKAAPASPIAPVQLAVTPVAGAPVRILAETDMLGGPSILIPLPNTAAAAFTRDGDLHVVFDAPEPLDLGGLKDDPVFGGATESLLPNAADFRLHTASGTQPRLKRRDAGWVLTLASAPPLFEPFVGKAAGGVLTFAAPGPGGVVTLEDAATGGRLLVGTQHEAGTRVLSGHAAAEFTLLPSWGGVVLQPRADRVRMRARDNGFEVSAQDPPALSLAWQNGPMALRADGQAMTRRYAFTSMPLSVLKRRLGEALRDAAQSPRTARTGPRLRVAEAMLASGLDAEAGAVLHVASADDPAASSNIDLRALSAMSAWLSARAGGAKPPAPGFDLASLGDSDEAVVWRAVLSPPDSDPAAAAAQLASRWPLLLDYPAALSRLMVSDVADILERGHQDDALRALLSVFADPALELPHAAMLARLDHRNEAIAILDRLASGRDRLLRAHAMEAAVELRLALGQLTPDTAAAALNKQLYAWRDGARELRLRQHIADLQAKAGHWRRSLASLRETDQLYPASHEAIHAAEVRLLAGLLHDGHADRLDALDLIALADDASSLLGPADTDGALAPLLAEKLVALDLPSQAEPILRRLMDRAAEGPPKAEIGLRLASLLAENDDDAGALAALEASERGQLESPLALSRTLLKSRTLMRAHRVTDALALLEGESGAESLELQASLQEGQQDWRSAEHALATYAATPGFLRESAPARREVILRAVRDAVEGHDMDAIRRWRIIGTPLFDHAQNGELFSVLTAEPVKRVGDLARAAAELGAIRALPASLAVASAKP